MSTAVLRRLGVSSRPAVVRPPQLLYRCIILPARPQVTGRPAPSVACSKWTKMDSDNKIQSPGETYTTRRAGQTGTAKRQSGTPPHWVLGTHVLQWLGRSLMGSSNLFKLALNHNSNERIILSKCQWISLSNLNFVIETSRVGIYIIVNCFRIDQ